MIRIFRECACGTARLGEASCSEALADRATRVLVMVAALGLLGYGLAIAVRISEIV